MNGAQLHLLINHFPVVGFPIIAFAFFYALVRKQESVEMFAYILTIGVWITGLISYLTGDGAEEVLKVLPGFSEELIHQHEDQALISLIVTGIAGVLALTMLPPIRQRLKVLQSQSFAKFARLVFGVAILVGCAGFAYAAHKGGLIRHTEIRPA